MCESVLHDYSRVIHRVNCEHHFQFPTCCGSDGDKIPVVSVVVKVAAQLTWQLHLIAPHQPSQGPGTAEDRRLTSNASFTRIYNPQRPTVSRAGCSFGTLVCSRVRIFDVLSKGILFYGPTA